VLRLPPAGFPAVARRRPRGRAGAAAFVAVAGVFAAAIFFWASSTTMHTVQQ
jgi:hypothetical protein